MTIPTRLAVACASCHAVLSRAKDGVAHHALGTGLCYDCYKLEQGTDEAVERRAALMPVNTEVAQDVADALQRTPACGCYEPDDDEPLTESQLLHYLCGRLDEIGKMASVGCVDSPPPQMTYSARMDRILDGYKYARGQLTKYVRERNDETMDRNRRLDLSAEAAERIEFWRKVQQMEAKR
jgi:hypothetical protein